jgi:protein-S-isoprenylcysteine O-methyltransferase Ste14
MIFIGIFYGIANWLKSPKILSYPFSLIGLPFIISGVLLAIWCFKVSFELPKKPMLVKWGPWAHVRHPIYLAGILTHIGGAIILGTVVQLFGALFYVLIDPLITPLREEPQLREAFPVEYEEYSKQVPGWFPRIRVKSKKELKS